jgi:5-methylcytosine-specific restriction endonuclease McrA
MLNLPRQQLSLPNGKAPMPKPSRVARVVNKKVAKRREDKAIEKATGKAKPERKPIGARLRSMVMERDSNCCTVCGQIGTKENPLQVDHVVPVAAGGTNCESNLRTLCRACNVGKGARRVKPTAESLASTDRMLKQLAELVGKKRGAK